MRNDGGLFFDEYGVTGFGFAVYMLLAVFLVVGGIIALATSVDRAECRQIGRETGNAVKYAAPAGCFVQVDGRWIPGDKWRGVSK